MPIYEYRCQDCQQVFSRLRRMSASADGLSCPHCGSNQIDKLLSGFAASGKRSAGPGCGASSAGST